MRFLDSVPYSALVVAALLLGLAPFRPQPHLFEKLLLLSKGELVRPIDIFDLLLHSFPLLLLAVKAGFDLHRRNRKRQN